VETSTFSSCVVCQGFALLEKRFPWISICVPEERTAAMSYADLVRILLYGATTNSRSRRGLSNPSMDGCGASLYVT